MHLLAGELRHDVLAWMRDCDSIALLLESRLALARGHVDEVDVRKRVEYIVVVCAAGDRDWSAVHVQLTVADAVVPQPSQRQYTVRKTFGKREGERVSLAIAVRVDRASAFEDLDDLEGRVGGGLFVFCDRDLTGAASVRS
jgi:hypothetical protein